MKGEREGGKDREMQIKVFQKNIKIFPFSKMYNM